MFFSSILYVAFVSGPKCTCLHFDKLFADDTKLYDEERASLQNDIDRLVQWSRLAVKIQ
jgi:hypothetical protein